ncbi:MAG: hypothetical protein ACI87O_001368, partial [Planctomycetota bacterium]
GVFFCIGRNGFLPKMYFEEWRALSVDRFAKVSSNPGDS